MAKNKPKKNTVTRQNKGTLDQKHTEKINQFEKLNDSLPQKKQKLIRLQNELNELLSMDPKQYTHDNIRRKAHLMDIITNMQYEINSIENCTDSLNYIVKTLPILVDYYDNNQIIDDGMEEELINETNDTGKKNILSYFIKESNQASNNINKKSSNDKDNNGDNGDNGDNKIIKSISRAKLYDNYLNAIDTSYRKNSKKNSNLCNKPECGGEKILSQNDSYLVCIKCGLSETILLNSEKPNYKEPTQDSGTYAYKRINHLTEILSQLQAKESTDIPPKVFENILRELKKRKIDKNDLDIFRLRRILKKLNYRKYYEHVPHILQIINGKEPPNFNRRDEQRIKKMFKQIQKPFTLYCPEDRKNFLNYSYVLHKFCELLELDDYVAYFPLLKNNTKLIQHDKIWKQICKYMRWEFLKSL